MSKVSTAYDALLARLAALLLSSSGWAQMANAYDVPSNPATFLKQAYGIAIGAAENARLEVCHLATNRNFSVSICREVFKTDDDATGYSNVAKTLMEDLFLVIKDFETNVTLNGGQIFCEYLSDSGIQPIENGDFSAMYVQANFQVKLIEDLT